MRIPVLTFGRIFIAAFAAAALNIGVAEAQDSWGQFRGPEGKGRASAAANLPEAFGPDTNVQWKIAVPPGHASPVVWKDRIVLAASPDGKLKTLVYDAADGKLLWEAEAPREKLEPVHRIGNHAQSTPAADDDGVVSFFGSAGLFCYDWQGKLQWRVAMGPFPNDFGAASSPILHGDLVLLVQDHDSDSFLAAYDKRTGALRWKTERSDCFRNFSTPVLWTHGGETQVVVAGTLRVAGYRLADGKERWTVRGLARTVCTTPTVGDDGMLYVSSWASGGDAGERFQIDRWEAVLPEADKNKDGLLAEDELPKGPVKQRFTQVDRDKDSRLDRDEWELFRQLSDKSQNSTIAVKPGAAGEATETHLAWTNLRFAPFCSSPVYADGALFTVKDGGIYNVLAPADGKPLKQGRLPGTKDYYASPVAGDGKVFCFDETGSWSILRSGPKWEVLASGELGEEVFATPAIVGDRIFVRTREHLYAFRKPPTGGK